MTELERELRGLAAAIAFPETPEIAASVRLAPRTERRAPAILAHGRRRGRRRDSRSPSRPAWRCRRRERRSCTCSGSARSGSSSSTACPRSGPMPRSTSAPRSIPPTRPSRCSARVLGEPDGIYREGDVVTLLYGTPERVRALDHGDRGLGLHARGRQEARRGRDASRIRRRSAASIGSALWITGEPHVVDLPGGPATAGRQHADLDARPADDPARGRRDAAAGTGDRGSLG